MWTGAELAVAAYDRPMPMARTDARDARQRDARQRDAALLTRWAQRELAQPSLRARDVSWDHAESHVLALAASATGTALAYAKVHRQPRKYRQEVAALRRWAPATGAAPTLLAAREAPPRALLMSACPGAGVDDLHALDPRQSRVHRAAGSWLRRLHDLAVVDDDPVDLAQAMHLRLQGWARRRPGLVDASTLDAVARLIDAADWSCQRRRPCHGDFGPRNWLWHDETGLSVIDFEHAKADVWAIDLHKLVDGAWWGRPDLEDAFWEGYGRVPGADEQALIAAVRALYAVGTVVWGRSHDDAPFEAWGRTVLARLGTAGA